MQSQNSKAMYSIKKVYKSSHLERYIHLILCMASNVICYNSKKYLTIISTLERSLKSLFLIQFPFEVKFKWQFTYLVIGNERIVCNCSPYMWLK